MNDKQKKTLSRIIMGAVFYIIAIIISKISFPYSNWVSFVVFIVAYIIAGKVEGFLQYKKRKGL